MNNNTDPFYPISVDDYPKLFDYVLTRDGLIFFHDLKRDFILGRSLSQDDYNKLRLLQIYYATNNRNTQEVQKWKEMCMDLEDRGIPETGMYVSKKSLIDDNLVILNPQYVQGLYAKHIEYAKNNTKK